MTPVGGAGLDVIVRIHAIARLPELERCLLSLIGQTYRPLVIHIVTQRFSPDDLATLQRLLDILARLEPDAALCLHNFTEAEPADARSCLINLGFAQLQGRYVYLLDYDDVTTPHGCATLIADLVATGATISFGKVIGAQLTVDGPIIMTRTRQDLYRGGGVTDMFRQNFCPIHSFIVDRSRLPAEALWFDPDRSRDEDYDFQVGDAETEARWAAWRRSAERIAERRATTLVSPRVQRQLGRIPDPALTVARLLETTP